MRISTSIGRGLVSVTLAYMSACAGRDTAPSTATDGGIASNDVGSGLVLQGIGPSCVGGCAGADLCTVQDDSCLHQQCLFDARKEPWDAYCTADCTMAECPVGYSCQDVGFSLARACVADAAVCGDRIIQRGEACDDGNQLSGDGCVADCSEVDVAPEDQRRVLVSVTFRYEENDTELERSVDFDAQLNDSSVECPRAVDVSAGSSPTHWRSFSLESCGPDVVRFEFVGLFAQGTFTQSSPIAPSMRIYLQREGWPLPLIFGVSSTTPNDERWVVSELTAGGAVSAVGGANGTFTGTLALNNTDIACSPERPGCPDVGETMEIEGPFSLRNTEWLLVALLVEGAPKSVLVRLG